MKRHRKRRARGKAIDHEAFFSRLGQWSFRIAMFCGVLLLVVMTCRLLFTSSFLALRHFDVYGGQRLGRQEILRMLNLHPGRSLLRVPLKTMRQQIEAHPLVERAWVERVFPHTLQVRIQERRPVARVILKNESFLVDSSGTLFSPRGAVPRGDWIPLYGLSESEFRMRPKECQRIIQAAVELLGMLREEHGGWGVEGIGMNLDRGLQLALMDGPCHIRLGFTDLAERIKRLEQILVHLEDDGRREKMQWIDLRYSSRAIVKFNS